MVGLSGIEPLTSRLSGARSNHLSYRPPHSLRRSPGVSRLARSEGQELRREQPSGRRFARARSSPESIRIAHACVEPIETTWRLWLRRAPRDPRISRRRWLDWRLHRLSPRKEVIQPHLPVRLPCYDLAPITGLTLGGYPPCGLAHRLRVLPTFVA